MEEPNRHETNHDSEKSTGFGSGVVVGVITGIGLFLLTVQILYLAK
jgi:hypothetical protein